MLISVAMASGMWSATSGAVAQSHNLDVVANNLANADTNGYKKDVSTFKEYLASQERPHVAHDIPRGAFKDKDFYPLDGKDQSHVVSDGTYTSFKPGSLRVTENKLDLAIDGPGFIEVGTPQGLRYTRLGSLKIAADGKLVTTQGFPVLSSQATGLAGNTLDPNSMNPVARTISLRDRGSNISITDRGEIYAGEELIARLSITEFQDLKKIRKAGAQLFENLDPANRQEASHSLVRQGMLETSNVNPVEEMVNMINANRLFEQDMKALKTYGELMSKEVNEVGKL